MSKLTQLLGAGLVVAAMMFLVPATQAEVMWEVGIDMADDTTDPINADGWNVFFDGNAAGGWPNAKITDAKTLAGGSTGIEFDQVAGEAASSGNHPTAGLIDSGTLPADLPESAAGGVMWASGTNDDGDGPAFADFALTNVDPSLTYTLKLYTGHPGTDKVAVFSVFDQVSDSINPVDNTEWVVFENIQANENNEILFSVMGTFPQEGSKDGFYFNAMKLEAVPEPATMALLGLGGLAMIRRRRA